MTRTDNTLTVPASHTPSPREALPMIGGGEMSRRVRDMDWAATPLGDQAMWPEALVTLMRLLLASKQAMFVNWGPERILLYNDAYAAILGAKHPTALGRPVSEVWAENWDDIALLVDRVYAGHAVQVDNLSVYLHRNGTPEEAHFAFSYTPVLAEGGAVQGLFCACTETTRQVLDDRHEKKVRMRLEAALKVARLGTFEWFPATGLVDLDARCREIYDAPDAGDVQAGDIFSRVAPEDFDRVVTRCTDIIERASRSDADPIGERISLDYDFLRPDGSRRAIFSSGVVFQGEDGAWRMLGAVSDATEIKRAEVTVRYERDQALGREIVARADAERVQLALAAGAIIGTWVWDLPADRFTVDDAFATAFGLDPALGREGIPLAQIVATVHPDDQAGLAEAINDAIKRGGRYAHQYRVLRRDGRYHWLEANGHVEHGPDGTPLRFPGVLLDVTARRYDVAFGELSERLRTLRTPQEMAMEAARTVGVVLDLSRVAYGDVDAAGRHITLDQDWLAEGQRSIRGTHEFEDFGSYVEALRRGEDVTIEDVTTDVRSAAQTANFQAIDVAALVNLPLMEHGRLKVVFCLNDSRPRGWGAKEVAFAHRVMERTEVEIARYKAETNLREMNLSLERQVEERTQERNKIWQTSRDILAVADTSGVLQSINPAWTDVLGWSAHEVVGRNSEWLEHPDDRAKTRAETGKLAAGATTLNFENRLRTRTGNYRTLVWSAVPEGDRFYCAGRDVTAEREQATLLLQAEEALRQSQKMEAVGQLTGGVAHDFNNLLTIIRSSVDFLRRPDLPEERRTRYMDAVSDTVDRAAKLTGQLLVFARRQVLKPEVFDVGAKLRGIGDMLDTVTGARITVSIKVPDEPCYARADISQFETALVNMAVNARDAMDGEGRLVLRLGFGAPKPAIRAHPASEDAFVALSITDTGTGIAPDRLGRIFEPFFTTKEVGKGTGLGLSQVFGFAKQSDGDIDVRSVVGEGTTFTLYLPQENVCPEGATDGDVSVSASPAGAGQRVLVVEDNVEVGQFCTQILEDLGYITEWSATAEEALVRLGDDGAGFDVVFSDVVMPGMGGVALAEILRERLPGLPVVLASGYSHVLAQENDHRFELLHKPYSAEQLARILQRVMAKPSAARVRTTPP